METQTISLIVGGVVQIVVALIAGFAAYASRRAEKAANHGNKKIAELQEQLMKMSKRVESPRRKR